MADTPRSRDRTGRGTWGPVLVAVGVVAVTAGVLAVTALPPERGVAAGSAATSDAKLGPFEALTTTDGDAVTAAGVVVAAPGAPVMLCRAMEGHDMSYQPGQEPPPKCSPLAVPLSDLEVATLPGWIERDGVWFTDDTVTVDGVWRDGALAVASVSTGGSPWPPWEADSWDMPCQRPAAGWVDGDGMLSVGMDPQTYETIMATIGEEVAAHPERYHGDWIGYPDGDPFAPGAPTGPMGEPAPEHLVRVVSTVDDPAAVHAHLATLYPGNLCVTQVDHSLAALLAVADRLAVSDGWSANTSSIYAMDANRVLVEMPLLDAAAVTRIGADAALVEAWPLVRPI